VFRFRTSLWQLAHLQARGAAVADKWNAIMLHHFAQSAETDCNCAVYNVESNKTDKHYLVEYQYFASVRSTWSVNYLQTKLVNNWAYISPTPKPRYALLLFVYDFGLSSFILVFIRRRRSLKAKATSYTLVSVLCFLGDCSATATDFHQIFTFIFCLNLRCYSLMVVYTPMKIGPPKDIGAKMVWYSRV